MPCSTTCQFTCILCNECPRKCNRSELYRHYAQSHFSRRLLNKFGDVKICPMCNQTLNRGATVSHFGQKHSMVELYLPIEAWIPFLPSKKRSSKKRVPSANAKRRKTSELSDSDQSWEIENNVDLDSSWESKRYVPSSISKRRKTSENSKLSDSDQSWEIENTVDPDSSWESKKCVPFSNSKRRKTSELRDSDQSWEIENNVDLDSSWESKRYVPSSTAKRRKTSENYELSDSDQSCEIENNLDSDSSWGFDDVKMNNVYSLYCEKLESRKSSIKEKWVFSPIRRNVLEHIVLKSRDFDLLSELNSNMDPDSTWDWDNVKISRLYYLKCQENGTCNSSKTNPIVYNPNSYGIKYEEEGKFPEFSINSDHGQPKEEEIWNMNVNNTESFNQTMAIQGNDYESANMRYNVHEGQTPNNDDQLGPLQANSYYALQKFENMNISKDRDVSADDEIENLVVRNVRSLSESANDNVSNYSTDLIF